MYFFVSIMSTFSELLLMALFLAVLRADASSKAADFSLAELILLPNSGGVTVITSVNYS